MQLTKQTNLKLALLVLLLTFAALCPAKSWATWTAGTIVLQSCTTTSSTCSVSISPNVGQVLVCGFSSALSTDTLSSCSDSHSSYTVASSCNGSQTNKSVGCGYTLNVTFAITSVTVTRSSSTASVWYAFAVAFSSTATPFFNGANNSSNGTSSTTQTFPSVTLTNASANSAFLVATRTNSSTFSACTSSAGATTTFNFAGSGFGVCYFLNATNGAGHWTTGLASSASGELALGESSPSGLLPLLGVGE